MITYGMGYIHKNSQDQVLILETLQKALQTLGKRVSVITIET